MSKIVVNNTTRTVSVYQTGRRGLQGEPGLTWLDAGWLDGAEYAQHDALLHDGSSYRAKVEHVAVTATEPGRGEDWQSVWEVLALGTDVETAEVVAGIADEITTVAGIAGNVTAVAEIASDVVTVAGKAEDVSTVAGRIGDVSTVAAADTAIRTVAARDADITTVADKAEAVEATANIADKVVTVADNADAVALAADKMDAIEAAPGAAQASGEHAEASQKWAEGTEPGGPGTKSSKEYASDAAGSAATAAAATLIGYGVSVYNATGVDAGEYYAERRATQPSSVTAIYAEIIDGDAGSEVAVVVLIGGVPAAGPFNAAQGAPFSLEGLSLPVSMSDGVSFMLTPTPGAVREVFVKTYGAVTT